MEINGTAKEPVKDSSGDVVDYYFTFTDLDASMFYEGCVITGKFTTYVGIMPMSATGYLKTYRKLNNWHNYLGEAAVQLA